MRRGRLGFWLRLAVGVLLPLLRSLTRQDWRGRHHVPRMGGVILCTNHISHADPFAFAHFVWKCGRVPRFLAKASLFRLPFFGTVLRGTGQIPVYRESEDATHAYAAAMAALRRGEAVIIYPEATITRDAQLWPMTGKTGAARLALETGSPLVPVAQWGPHELLPPYSLRPRLLPRKTMRVAAGPPVNLSDLREKEVTTALLYEATDRIIEAITVELVQIRGEAPPAERFDPRTSTLPRTGRPRSRDRRADRKSA